ncbi:MAG: efflux RND transporter periplasmic adaptor subunit [Mangrovibacterium sp.]
MKPSPLIFIALFATAFASCQVSQKTHEEQELLVETTLAKQTDCPKLIRLSGNLEPKETVRLGFMVAGKIDEITPAEGDYVAKGSLLARLESNSYEQGLIMANAQLNQMQDDYTRVSELFNRKSIAESELIKVQNGLKAAQAQAKLQQTQLDDTKLFAPIDGILLKRGVEKGEIIDKGIPLFALANLSEMKVSIAIPEHELHEINLGDTAQIYVAALKKNFEGEISEVGALVDGSTRSYTAKISIDNPNGQLQLGMLADVELSSSSSSKLLTLPANCILKSPSNEYYVYVLDNNRAFRRLVSIGRLINNDLEITSGLQANEQIICSKLSELSNGSLIRIQ